VVAALDPFCGSRGRLRDPLSRSKRWIKQRIQ
jgi:hypothetical protein